MSVPDVGFQYVSQGWFFVGLGVHLCKFNDFHPLTSSQYWLGHPSGGVTIPIVRNGSVTPLKQGVPGSERLPLPSHAQAGNPHIPASST